MSDIANLRRDYTRAHLRREDLDPNPFAQFKKWLDQALGAELAKDVASRADWVKDRPAQQSVKRQDMMNAIRAMLTASATRAGS